MESSENKKKYSTTKNMLILRIVICGYFLYTVYSLVNNYIDGEGLSLPVLITASVIFGGFGLVVGIISIIELIKGRYSGGKGEN